MGTYSKGANGAFSGKVGSVVGRNSSEGIYPVEVSIDDSGDVR